jgi:hypothetical protein
MVDRSQRRKVQNGQRQDQQSDSYVCYERQRLGSIIERPFVRNLGSPDWPPESSGRPENGEEAGRNVSLKVRLNFEPDVRRRIGAEIFARAVVSEVPLD